MLREGQIYEYTNGEKYIITSLEGVINAIFQSGWVARIKRFSGDMRIYGKLIAEYPTWQEAVNSPEFKGEER